MKSFFGWAIILLAVMGTAFGGLTAAATYSRSLHECPDGNDCYDTTNAWKFGATIALASAAIGFGGYRLTRAGSAKHDKT